MPNNGLFLGFPPHLIIDIVFESSANSAPSWFKPAVLAAAAQLGSLIYSPIRASCTVGWGTINGSGFGGVGGSNYSLVSMNYVDVRAALIARAKSANALQAVSTLPASPPGQSTMQVGPAQAIHLGGGISTPPYCWCGFGTGQNWSFSGTPGVGQIEFNEACLHELAEAVLGRFCFEDSFCSVPDLYCYQSNGVRNLGNGYTSGQPRYFSIDSGATNLRSFNTISPGDTGDWAGAGGPSPFDSSATTGQLVPLKSYDLTMIDVLGWSSLP